MKKKKIINIIINNRPTDKVSYPVKYNEKRVDKKKLLFQHK